MRKALTGALIAATVGVGSAAVPVGAHEGHRDHRDHRDRTSEVSSRHRQDDGRRGGHHWDRDGKDRRHDGRHDKRDGRHDHGNRGERGHRGERGDRQLTAEEREFLVSSGQLAFQELHTGRLAMLRSGDAAVQEYGRQMVVDHFKQLVGQLGLMRKHDIPLPELTSEQLAELAALTDVADADFDRAYLTSQVEGHVAAIEQFTAIIDTTQDRKLQRFAKEQKQVLESHLNAAEVLLASMPAPAA